MFNKFQQAIIVAQASKEKDSDESNYGPELKESDWFAYQEQLNDWISKLEQTKKLLGNPLSEKDMMKKVDCVAYVFFWPSIHFLLYFHPTRIPILPISRCIVKSLFG